MRTQVEFTSDAFPPFPGESDKINPGIWGQRLAEYIVSKLPDHAFTTRPIYAEDWGWEIPIENQAFPLFIGCGNQTEPGGNQFLCVIDPSTPTVRTGWFNNVSTVADVTRLAEALDKILTSHPGIQNLRWQDDDER